MITKRFTEGVRLNSTYKKLAVQWLNEVQFFNQTFVQVDSFVLRNRQLLIAAKRWCSSPTTSLSKSILSVIAGASAICPPWRKLIPPIQKKIQKKFVQFKKSYNFKFHN